MEALPVAGVVVGVEAGSLSVALERGNAGIPNADALACTARAMSTCATFLRFWN